MDYLKINKATWNERTKIHIQSEFYNVNGFLNGDTSLREIELAEMGETDGKSLLHLQCHFGMDTLSWARKGAMVTGVDLSPVAIEQAKILTRKAKLKANFICSDVYEFGKHSSTDYDIVFTSYGALCWLPNLAQWAETVASSLKPHGKFYIAEFHPVFELVSGYPYFHSGQPDTDEVVTYTENNGGRKFKDITWAHPISDVINALINVGIKIDHLNEFPFSPFNCFEGLEKREEGRFYVANSKHAIPLVYSILGTKIK